MDYFSVPQVGDYHGGGQSDLMKAVESIPAYVERCSHFFAVTPSVEHRDLSGTMCNLGSWLRRGWCRVEMISLLLSRFSRLPVIVVKGPQATPYLLSPATVMSRPPGKGDLTCCARHHQMSNSDGTMRTIPCDRDKIGPVIWTLLQSRLNYLAQVRHTRVRVGVRVGVGVGVGAGVGARAYIGYIY